MKITNYMINFLKGMRTNGIGKFLNLELRVLTMIVLFITIFDPPKKFFLKIFQFVNPRGASEVKKAYFTFLAEPFSDGTFLKFYGKDLGMLIYIKSMEVPTRRNNLAF